MYPFRVRPEPIDRVTCGNCGHPAWDHFVTDNGVECDTRDAGGACRHFALHGFEANLVAFSLADDFFSTKSA